MKETYTTRLRILHSIGFGSYREYLESDLWARIRRRTFSVKGKRCMGCQRDADSIHHMTYARATLLGRDITHLIPCCGTCHVMVEYDGQNKRNVCEMQPVAAAHFRVPIPPEIGGSKDKKPWTKKGPRRRTRKQKRRFAIVQMGGTGTGSIANYNRVLAEHKAKIQNRGA